MPDTPKFVVNDRRKFTSEGELRHDHDAEPAASRPAEPASLAGTPSDALSASSLDTRTGPQLVGNSDDPTLAPGMQVSASGGLGTEALTDLPESQAIGALEDEPLSSPSLGDAGSNLDDLDGQVEYGDETLPPGPNAEQSAEATRAYNATVDRLDTAMRAADPGGERMPEMSFERLTQSLYTQALLLLGGGAQPGETPRVDILGARQTIDMLAVIAEKTKGNLSDGESKLLESALFDLQMGFLEITQALARQAAQRGAAGPGGLGAAGAGAGGLGAGPRIVR